LQRIKYYLLMLFVGAAAYPSDQAILLTGLLDPIPLISRSFNLFVLPVVDTAVGITSVTARLYQGSWLIFMVFMAAILGNLLIPRLYCRFICPLGALFGLISRLAVWRIGKMEEQCKDCKMCERYCEGGCAPSTNIRVSECVLCCNCIDPCPDKIITYQSLANPTGAEMQPNISRRGFSFSLVSGFFSAPAFSLADKSGNNWNTGIIRPPGSLAEQEFLQRCIKCGQCMRVCPTNVLQPIGLEYGLESLWTPMLNNRIGSSGCQLNCTVCSQVCPTAAIRPITLNEKLGRQEFAEKGPVKLGTAFLQRGRCLPWAMDKPCIVCEENCPLSPKAIFTRTTYVTVRNGQFSVNEIEADAARITITGQALEPGKYGSGDYYCLLGDRRYKITANGKDYIMLEQELNDLDMDHEVVAVQVRLQRPYVDIEKCTGCGVCEHECPVNGKKAIRVTAEGETRNPKRALLLKR
jgi:ferredoxin